MNQDLDRLWWRKRVTQQRLEQAQQELAQLRRQLRDAERRAQKLAHERNAARADWRTATATRAQLIPQRLH
ncbi:hypothetical protein [Imhoffiella purpurea]|uniref:Uncharacterized protein n=1 Tax=Imhoffiella purpurea TaxID=1249627 RepID=W9VBZ5_9GAMM|nr:hypothetical protein [Imhoffiella purpurea]EXJ16949.1 hypothetical protein D779_1772 [Imhoffiella purpurea]